MSMFKVCNCEEKCQGKVEGGGKTGQGGVRRWEEVRWWEGVTLGALVVTVGDSKLSWG